MFVIVRHGNTFAPGETPRRIGARTDLSLTEGGKIQADRLGRHFAERGLQFDRAFVSPLLRTRETARLILAHLPGSVIPEPADFLLEIDHGPDENVTEHEVVARIGRDALIAWDQRAVEPIGWQVNSKSRISAWTELFSVETRPTLVVTSNGAARFALLAANVVDANAELKLSTGAYGELYKEADSAMRLECWNRLP
ncbi:histidine phosphatase family protein [Novosphingobium sp.]|uniref:histidine phosphatase family protein n=1 Tax=Novosphingobium sp. TaxID=1874826 RepID=UPI0025FEF42F|nr:histidine phosphatase family protein [Novosphingobium sp.]